MNSPKFSYKVLIELPLDESEVSRAAMFLLMNPKQGKSSVSCWPIWLVRLTAKQYASASPLYLQGCMNESKTD